MAIEAGTRLGPYELTSRLGSGGMGEVYRARDVRLGREVAVKVLPERVAGDAEALARFEREARAVASLSHPNILALHDYGREGGVTYAVMELLEGETLRDRMGGGSLPVPRAVSFAMQIAQGLTAAHEKGIVHRDLKPENVFVSPDGHVKVLDFGLAKSVGIPEAGPGITALETLGTAAGIVLGTVGYMSPEQLRGEPAGPQADIFAAGVILYEMIAGKNPFRRPTAAEMMVALLREEAPPLSDSVRSVPPELEEVVAHCLEKHPGARFQTARDLAFALRVLERSGGRADRDDAPLRTSSGASGPVDPGAGASVAVLPFRNMSSDPEAEYFSDGVTEEIISTLSHIAALRVAARTSCFAFKGKDTDVRNIGRELGVGTVLEGSVRQAGRRLRIHAQLIDVATGYHLWSERYDRELEDVFAVQDEIARSIAETLEPRLTGGRAAPLPERPTRDVEAYDLYLKGRHFWKLRRMRTALEHFEAAVRRDPQYASAYTAIADSYCIWGFYGGISSWEAYARARAAAERAQELTPDSAEVHIAFGVIEHYYGWDTARLKRELHLAIERDPKLGDAYFWLALCLSVSGRTEDALRAAEKGVALEPHAANPQTALAWSYAGARRYAKALPELQRAVELEPNAPFPLWSLGLSFLGLSRFDEAIETLERVVAVTQREHCFEIALLGCALAGAGRTAEARALLVELRERGRREYVPPFDLAVLHAALGEREAALAALEKSYDDRNGLLWYRIHMPMFDPLREEPRWRALAEKLARTAPVDPAVAGETSLSGDGR
jgi:serine/threonine protein kinase/tetratricopeptide (TPR) repeat protein